MSASSSIRTVDYDPDCDLRHARPHQAALAGLGFHPHDNGMTDGCCTSAQTAASEAMSCTW
ncbi:hypothetical protein [Lentzea terrae]|uniref:hypothetical protein n=1 Tax=Lentzea terrae TaxID=2200761 RepID=UPI0018E59D98|nr:hypothetical protein [Lentzea terrae]